MLSVVCSIDQVTPSCLTAPTSADKGISYPLSDNDLLLSGFSSLYALAQVLVVAPTQELCMQIVRTARSMIPTDRQAVMPLVGEFHQNCKAVVSAAFVQQLSGAVLEARV